MKKYSFLYIDDENDDSTAAIVDGLKDTNHIEVIYQEPREFKPQIEEIAKQLKNCDGLILDLKLDGKSHQVSYNAPAIAQELRMLAAQGAFNPFPIILCSTEEKMKATYDVDKTSHDLFDYKFQKQTTPPWNKFAMKMAALAKGYQDISTAAFDISKILSRSNLELLDPRILDKFSNKEFHFSVNEYAHFVAKTLFHHPEPLIKETLLAARLGVDIEASGEAWRSLLNSVFDRALYKGVFSEGWNRWWADMIISIFKEISGGARLATLNAEERVAILKKTLKIPDLVSAKPLPHATSTDFWTICAYHKKPLDPIEGFKTFSTIEPKPWQDHRFLSLDAILSKKSKIQPHPSELKRIGEIIKTLS